MAFSNPPPLEFTSSRLKGKVIFVTGASSGIGEAAVSLFAREGATVIAAARRLDKIQIQTNKLCEAYVPNRWNATFAKKPQLRQP